MTVENAVKNNGGKNMSYNEFLPCYSIGDDCYKEIPYVTRRYGKTAVVIGGKTAMEKAKPELLAALKGSDLEITDFIWYGGDSNYENIEMLKAMPEVQNADMVFGVGGGRAVDTVKTLCDRIDKPFFTFPTLASNCASCTAISVIYNADGTFKEYAYLKAPALHTFINTKIIAESPEKLFWAGIGDALSKEYEVVFACRDKDMTHTPLLGRVLAEACTEPLVSYGKKALEDCRNNVSSKNIEQIALDIIITTGLVSNFTVHQNNPDPKDDYYFFCFIIKSFLTIFFKKCIEPILHIVHSYIFRHRKILGASGNIIHLLPDLTTLFCPFFFVCSCKLSTKKAHRKQHCKYQNKPPFKPDNKCDIDYQHYKC